MSQQKRYQIFVSSTFADLEEERRKVMETILTYNCFPAGAETFPAIGEGIFEYIKRIIDDSDYFLLIIGGRYGAIDEDGVGWVEKEYDFAVSKGIPVIAFDHEDFTKLPANKKEQDDEKRKKLIAFKRRVAKGRLIRKWSNKDDLALAVSTSLKRVLELQPRIGWVRADSLQNDGVQKEIDRLQKESVKYQKEVIKLENDLKKKYKDYEQEIEYLKKQIKALEAAGKTSQDLRLSTENKPQTHSERFTVNGVSFKMIHVEGGTFMMGANGNDIEAHPDEKPFHEVALSDYWIGETQVTQALWQAVMDENPSYFKANLNHPVESVSWEDCQTFIRRLSHMTGKKFRLPTEAQWEFAARGGNLGKDNHYLYAGSNVIYDVGWYKKNSNKTTHPVGELDPNELGLYDMTGNVWEWCNDWYGDYYINSATVDPTGPVAGSYRVCRGGGLNSIRCYVSSRNHLEPGNMYADLGLRLAL